MPPELEPPLQTTNAEPTPETPLEMFPYETTRAGATLAQTARETLRSSDDESAANRTHQTDGTTVCPDCESETINGAGLFTCPDCAWVGTIR